MTNLENRIEALMADFDADVIEKAVAAAKEKKQKEKEAHKAAVLKETREKTKSALMTYANALGLLKGLSNEEIINLNNDVLKGLEEFEKNIKKLEKLDNKNRDEWVMRRPVGTKSDEDIINDFFKSLHKVGLL